MPKPGEIEEQEIIENRFLEDLKFVKTQVKKWFVTNIFQRTLAHLVGWTGTHSKMIRCTSDGRLRVTTEVIGVTAGYFNQVVIGAAATLIRPANTDRVSIAIQCVSANSVYIGLDNSVLSTKGFLLATGQVLSSDVYLGAFFGIEDGDAGRVAVIEV
ncbi:hypothetical protein ES703_120857 [subsurface metagenome]